MSGPAALPRLDAGALARAAAPTGAELAAFLAGGAPSLEIALDPRVAWLGDGARWMGLLEAPPAGSRMTLAATPPGLGRSTLALQLAARSARLAGRRALFRGRGVAWSPAATLELLRDRGDAWVVVVDDAHECVDELFDLARGAARELGRDVPLDVVVLAEASQWAEAGGDARPWARLFGEVAVFGRDAAIPSDAPGPWLELLRAAGSGGVTEALEDAWRDRAREWTRAEPGSSDRAPLSPEARLLVTLAVPQMLGLAPIEEALIARAQGLRGAGDESDGDAAAVARLACEALAVRAPLRRVTTSAGAGAWSMRHPVIAGAVADALLDGGAEVLLAPLTGLVAAALALEASRGEKADPDLQRCARLAAHLARPPEAVRWIFDGSGIEDVAVRLAEHAAAASPRVDLFADHVVALRRAGSPERSAEVAEAYVARSRHAPAHARAARRLVASWAISEWRRGGDAALEKAVWLELLALSDDVPASAGGVPEEAELTRGAFESWLRTLAWLGAAEPRSGGEAGASEARLRERLRALAPFARDDAPERLESDESRARIEVSRPSDVPFEPEEFRALLAELEGLARGARPAGVTSEPLAFDAATRLYRRFVAARVGPLVRALPPGGDADAVQAAFERHLEERGIEPYETQMEAYFSIFAGSSVLLVTPTGSGKSLVALAAHFAALGLGERSVYTAPTKALVNEKFFDLCRRFGSANVGLLTGDASVNRDAPILCCTAEILSSIAQVEGASRPFGWVVMDEFHYFSDPERGIAWLLPLILLEDARFLLMSATIGQPSEAKRTVAALASQDFELVHSTERPVPLVFDYKVMREREAINELRERDLLPAYVVCITRAEAAEKALGEPSSGGWSSKAADVPDHAFTSPFGKQLKRALRSGIGLHHSGLLPKYRRIVETMAAEGRLKLVFGTDTLGVGVDLPIRTVLFPQLVRNSGRDEYVRLDAARFQQLAGRAGRAGYLGAVGDPRGDVWVLAPEDEVERARAAAKAAAKGGKPKPKKAAAGTAKGKLPSWSEQTMQNLVASPARPLELRFEVTPALVMNFVRRGDDGVERLRALIEHLPLKAGAREAARADVDRLLAALVARREVREAEGKEGYAVGERSSHRADAGPVAFDRPLLRFLHDVAWDFVPEGDGPALDVLTLVESVVDDPRVILGRQAKKARDEQWAEHRERGTDAFDQSARREFSEERAEIAHPQPLKDEIDAAFDRWDEEHPGLTRQMPSSKSIVRDMFELGVGFRDYVQHYGLHVVEGELLRYLSEVWRILTRGLPRGRRIERGTAELAEWIGAVVRHVDSSLIDEWERLDDPDRAIAAGEPEPAAVPYDVTTNERAFTRMVRNAAFRWVKLLASRRLEELAAGGADSAAASALGEAELAAALDAYLAECGRIELGADARGPSLFDYQHGSTRVEQTLLDPEGHLEWSLAGRVDLAASREEGDAVLVLERFARKGRRFDEPGAGSGAESGAEPGAESGGEFGAEPSAGPE